MVRLFYIIVFLFLVFSSSAQSNVSFDKQEARDMIALCNSFTQIKIFNTDKDIVPKNYTKVYTSGIYGLDNKFQIWLNDNQEAVIVFRGSTAKKASWLENMYSVMIDANGFIILPGQDTVNYRFAQAEDAKVHAGWSLGTVFLIQDIIHEIQLLNSQGIYKFIITGHSQGGALSQLSRAYLENLPENVISNQCSFRTYAFASPMIGNEAFIREYSNRYERNATSFSFYNPEDMIPKMPKTVNSNGKKLFSIETVGELLDSTHDVSFKDLAFRAATETFTKDHVESYIKLAGISVHEQIVKEIGPVTLPSYSRDLAFIPNPNRIVLGPFDKIEDQLAFGTDADSLSAETEGYRAQIKAIRGGSMYQHKTYNYYLYFLKKYYNSEYISIIEEQRYRWNRP
jgi:hypothetical protein